MWLDALTASVQEVDGGYHMAVRPNPSRSSQTGEQLVNSHDHKLGSKVQAVDLTHVSTTVHNMNMRNFTEHDPVSHVCLTMTGWFAEHSKAAV